MTLSKATRVPRMKSYALEGEIGLVQQKKAFDEKICMYTKRI